VDPVGRVQLRDQDGAVSLADPDGDRHRMGAEGGEGLEQTSSVELPPKRGRGSTGCGAQLGDKRASRAALILTAARQLCPRLCHGN
jgi:hypothetical protein